MKFLPVLLIGRPSKAEIFFFDNLGFLKRWFCTLFLIKTFFLILSLNFFHKSFYKKLHQSFVVVVIASFYFVKTRKQDIK